MKNTIKQENDFEEFSLSVPKQKDYIHEKDNLYRLDIGFRELGHYHRNVFHKNNIAMLIINAENGYIVNANLAACKFYGYTKKELKKLKITEIDILSRKEVFEMLQNSLKIHFQRSHLRHRIASGEIRDVEVYRGPLKIPGEEFVYFVIEDITERVRLENELMKSEIQYKELFNNANDAIFFGGVNEEGMPRSFINVNDRACKLLGYTKKEMLKNSPLEICYSNDYIEKFLNKFDDTLTSNRATYETTIKAKDGRHIPAEVSVDVFKLNENNVFLTIARDITEKKKLENILRENEERYRQIVNLIPDAIIITVDGKIVLANKEANKYFNNLIGKSVYKFVPKFAHIMDKRIKQIIKNKQAKTVFDYKITLDDNTVIDVEVSSSYLNFQGKPAVLSIMREITKRKRELNSAARMQKKLFKKPFTIPDKVKVDTLYVPAKTVSGDLLYLCKKNENLLVGIIGDVSGKGITAALNISAFNVLFHEAVLVSYDPSEILNNLNKKVANYLGERYIAACCFSFDFENKEVKVVGAGINQFIFQKSVGIWERKIVKGSFLGMFENSVFDEQIIQFDSGDRFYFYTDGLDFIFDDDKMNDIILDRPVINEITKGLKGSVNEMLTDVGGIEDDCTLIAMEIR